MRVRMLQGGAGGSPWTRELDVVEVVSVDADGLDGSLAVDVVDGELRVVRQRDDASFEIVYSEILAVE